MALATVAARRGANVTLVSGVTNLEVPLFVDYVPVESAEDMFETVTKAAPEQDIIIKSAAVADYTPVSTATEKIKKKEGAASIELKPTQDILKWLENIKPRARSCVDFPWKQKICWKIHGRNWKRKRRI